MDQFPSGLLRETRLRPEDEELLLEELDELAELDEREEPELELAEELGRLVVARLLVELDERVLDRSRLTDELLPADESGRALVDDRLGGDVARLRSIVLVRVVDGDALRVVGEDEDSLRVVDGVRVVDEPLDRSTLPLRSVDPRGTSLAPPIESITRSGTGVSRQFRSVDEVDEVSPPARDDVAERSTEPRSRPRSRQDELPFVSVRGRVTRLSFPLEGLGVAGVGLTRVGVRVTGGVLSGVTRSVRSGVTRSVRSGTTRSVRSGVLPD